jgi:hypothetical protein
MTASFRCWPNIQRTIGSNRSALVVSLYHSISVNFGLNVWVVAISPPNRSVYSPAASTRNHRHTLSSDPPTHTPHPNMASYGYQPPSQPQSNNLHFYQSSYSNQPVSGHSTPFQASYGNQAQPQYPPSSNYGGASSANYGLGAFPGQPGATGQMGTGQGGLRTGWIAAFGTEGYEGEPPLLEELGVNFMHIRTKV